MRGKRKGRCHLTNVPSQTRTRDTAITWSAPLTTGPQDATILSYFERITVRSLNVSIVLTGAIEACRDGVQKGVLGGQEALHHWHLDPDVGRPTAGLRSHHPRIRAGGFQGLSAGAGDFEADSPLLVVGTHIYSKSSHHSPGDASPKDNSAAWGRPK